MIDPQTLGSHQSPAPWMSVLLAQGQQPVASGSCPRECQPAEQPGSHCCCAVKPLCTGHIEHTSQGSQALSLLTGLLSVPTKKVYFDSQDG